MEGTVAAAGEKREGYRSTRAQVCVLTTAGTAPLRISRCKSRLPRTKRGSKGTQSCASPPGKVSKRCSSRAPLSRVRRTRGQRGHTLCKRIVSSLSLSLSSLPLLPGTKFSYEGRDRKREGCMHRRRDGGRAIFPLLLDALTSPQQHSPSYEKLHHERRLRESPAKSRNLYNCV